MTTNEAAIYLGVTPNHVSGLCRKRKLKAQKKGRRCDIDFISVRRYELGVNELQPVMDNDRPL